MKKKATSTDITQAAEPQQNESLFRALFEFSPDAVILIDPHDANTSWPIVDCNAAACQMNGYTRDELIGRSIDILNLAPAERGDYLQRLRQGGTLRYETHHCRKDGTPFPVEVSTTLIKIGDREFVIGIDRDISDRRRTEEAAQESESRFQGLVETVSDWIWEVDQNGVFTYVSPKIKDLLGYQPAEVLGKTPFDLMPPEEAQQAAGIFGSHLPARLPLVAVENVNLHKDGHPVVFETSGMPFFDANGNFKGYRGTNRDITERKQAERALKESEEKFRSIADNFAVGLFIHQNGMVRYIGREAARILGYDVAEVIGHSIMDFVHPEERQRVAEIARQRPAGKNVPTSYETRLLRKDGTAFDVLMYSTLIEYEGKVATQGAFLDITDRKQAEEAIKTEQQRFQTVLEAVTVPTLITRLSDSKVLYANQALAEIGNIDLQVLLAGKSVDYFADPTDRERVVELLQASGHVDDFETQLRRGDGGLYWVLLSSRLITYQGETCVLSSYVDITERKQAEQRLADSEERFRRFTGATVEGLIFHEQGVIVDINPAAVALIGLSDPKELIGRNLLEFIVPEEHQMVLQKMQSQTVLPYEIHCIHKNGSIFPVETATRAYGFGEREVRASTMRDITERKRSEEQLLLRERALAASLNAVIITSLDSKIVYVNDAFLKMSGYTREEALQLSPAYLAGSTEYVQMVQEQIQKQGFFIGENVLTRKDGVIFSTDFYVTPIINAEGKPIATLATFNDITDRKQAEAEVQREKALSDAIINSLPGTFFLADIQGRVIQWNKHYEEISGFTAEEVPTLNVLDVVAEEDRERALVAIQKIFTEGQMAVEVVALNKEGGRIPFYFAAQRLQLGDQLYLVALGTDISERKQAEQALRESEEKFRNLADSFAVGIFIHQDGIVRCMGREAARLIGREGEDLTGRSIMDFVHPEERQRIAEIARNRPAGETVPDQYETRLLKKDGSPLDVQMLSTLIEYEGKVATQGAFFDISGRRQAEAQVKQEKIFSDAIINGLPGIFYLFDTQGAMIRWNAQYEQVLGYTTEETASRNAIDPIAEEDRPMTAAAIQQAFMEGQGTVEAHVVTKDGRRIPYYFIGQRIQLGDQLYVAGTGIDISDRKRLEEEIRTALERRGLQVQLSTRVSQSIAAASGLEELYERVVTEVKEQFGYYHTQLLRYDPAQDAVVLVTGYGEVGAKMLTAGHRLPMGEGLIGTAAATGETVLRTALANDPDWHPNPLLPETKGEIAVPIKLGDTILGVLDVQSSAAGALDADDQLLLEGLCGQVAIAIESTRLRQQMAERLDEINRLYRAVSHTGWQDYRQTANIPSSFMYDQSGLRPVRNIDLAEELFATLPLTVPGGEVIGTLAVAEDAQRPITPEDESFLQQVSEQVALALESARLFEQTQSALASVQESQAVLDEAMNVAGMANWKLSFETFKFTFNDHLYQMLGTTVEEEGSYEISAEEYTKKYIHPEDAQLIAKAIQTGLQDPDPQNFKGSTEYRMIRKDGQVRYMLTDYRLEVNEQGQAVGGIGSFLDITERKLAELTVAKRAEELKTVATVSTTVSTMLDPDQLLQTVVDLTKERFGLYHAHIYLADESWNTLLLAAGAGEVGRKLVAEQHAIPINLADSLVARAARDRQAIIVNDVKTETGFLPNPLLPETCAEMAVPMVVGDKLLGVFDVQSNNPIGFSAEDANVFITLATQVGVALQNARLYVEQAALVTQLRELDKLKSSFLANMSHELRTPLNSILGFADVIIEELDGPLTENMSNDLRLIQKNGQHLLHLINDVLDMAKIEAGRMNLNPEAFHAYEVLEEVASITSTLASEKNLALFIHPDSDSNVKIYADLTRLRQVMINLVNNAIKFTETGSIALKIEELPGARILITVKDTGIGIPADKLDAIFQEFTQVDSSSTRKAGGTGLGLPISRRLVEMHGGRLWAESTGVSGEGSTFFVELPVEARITETIEKKAN